MELCLENKNQIESLVSKVIIKYTVKESQIFEIKKVGDCVKTYTSRFEEGESATIEVYYYDSAKGHETSGLRLIIKPRYL